MISWKQFSLWIVLTLLLISCRSTRPGLSSQAETAGPLSTPAIASGSPAAPEMTESFQQPTPDQPISVPDNPLPDTGSAGLPQGSPPAIQPTGTAQPGSGPEECPPGEPGLAAETARATLGPSPNLPQSSAVGETLKIAGVAYDRACNPLAGVRLNLWQTDAAGLYGPGQEGGSIECCYYQGAVTTDAGGRFEVITVKPGRYQMDDSPPAHIHFEVEFPGVDSGEREFLFADDPASAGRTAGERLIFLDPVEISKGEESYLQAKTALVLEVESQDDPAQAGRLFEILPDQSQVSYQIREKFADFPAMISAEGVTGLVTGLVGVDPDSGRLGEVLTMTIDLRGLRSDDPKRDEKLADRWLVTDEFPYAYFASTSIQNGPAQYEVGTEAAFQMTGDLVIREMTRPVTFDVRARLEEGTLTGEATGTIRMTDFGIDPPDLLGFVRVEDAVLLTVRLVAKESLAD